MDNSDRLIVTNTNISRAMACNLWKHTVAFMDMEAKDKDIASGILVRIDDRLFVATAAHAIPRTPQTRLSFVPHKPTPFEGGRLPILRSGKAEGGWPDVGFLELDIATAMSDLNKETIGLDRIGPQGPGNPTRRCFVCGFPVKWLRTWHAKNSGSCLGFKANSYSNIPIAAQKWPSVSSDDPPVNGTVDIFLPYDPKEELWYYEENQGDDDLPAPGGMSGGGIWQGSVGENELWTTDKIRLFGIQSRWSEKMKYLRGCQIINWLRLVHDQYSDLWSTLLGTFPELMDHG